MWSNNNGTFKHIRDIKKKFEPQACLGEPYVIQKYGTRISKLNEQILQRFGVSTHVRAAGHHQHHIIVGIFFGFLLNMWNLISHQNIVNALHLAVYSI